MAAHPTVLVTGQFSTETQALLHAAAPTADLRFVPKVSEAGDAMAEVDAIAGTIKAADLARAPKLNQRGIYRNDYFALTP